MKGDADAAGLTVLTQTVDTNSENIGCGFFINQLACDVSGLAIRQFKSPSSQKQRAVMLSTVRMSLPDLGEHLQ